MKRIVIALLLVTGLFAGAAEPPQGLRMLDFMLGEWRGTSRGKAGDGTVERTCAKALNDRFVECRTKVTYPGEVHVERSIYSYDKAAQKLRLRQFHGEGFVNTYAEAEPLVFVTTEIENVPTGWRARETHEQPSADSWSERFELAGPGKEFAVYTSSKLERVKITGGPVRLGEYLTLPNPFTTLAHPAVGAT